MLIVYSCQNFCNISKRLLYHVSVTRVQRTVLNSRVDSGGCHGALQGMVPCPATARHSLPQGRDMSRGMAAAGWLARGRGKKMETVFRAASIFQAKTE